MCACMYEMYYLNNSYAQSQYGSVGSNKTKLYIKGGKLIIK